MNRDRLKFGAALARFALAAGAFLLLPVIYPSTRPYRWVWVAYFFASAIAQEMIRRRAGGRARTILFGLVDAVVLTFTVHLLGSVSSPLITLYFFACVANALVGDLGVTFVLAAVNSLLYDGVVWAEWAGVLPFAPAAPNIALGRPPLDQVVSATAFLTAFMFAGTAIVGRLVEALDAHERQLVDANARLEALSLHDPLTELYNRRYLFDRLSTELARVRRGHPLVVAMLDLDRFKSVNDLRGHLAGDSLLREIGVGLVKTTRVTDVVGRYGGDEFVLLLPDTDAAQASIVAERVVECVRAAGAKSGAPPAVTASIGLAVATPSDDPQSLLKRADDNAYRAKQQGGDRFVSDTQAAMPRAEATG